MKEYHVLSHTHWDREWYQPFEEFRLRLVDLLDNLLEIFEQDADYVFHLDAQSIALEDYLEMRPHKRERLEELVREKRLLVGPWYVQNDFYLTSGEATIRNLITGSQIAEAFGFCSKTGYVPDQFGLIGQLPQIFNGFGIEGCIFGRGYNLFRVNKKGERVPVLTPNEFEWQSPDGSSVLTVLMRDWYNNAQRFSGDPAKAARFLELIDTSLEKASTTPYRLLMNGVDHLEAQENLLPILKTLDESLEGGTVFQSTMRNYLKKVRAHLKGRDVHAVQGELREGVNEQILQGTLSSRPYLKTSNARAQALLELQLEPLWSMLGLLTNDQTRYPQDELRYAWRMLMKNHPHDSICGCSRDEVHRDNEQRFKRVFEMGNDLLRRGGVQLASRIDRSELKGAPYFVAVANTLPTPRSETVTARVYLPCQDGIENVALKDDRGRAVEFDILENRQRNRTTITAVNLPGQIACRELVIRFFAEKIPACGYRVFTLEPCKGVLRLPKLVSSPKTVVLENEFLKVMVNARGKVTLLDKTTGVKTADLLTLTDEADAGHSYNFMAAKGDQPEIISDTVPAIRLLEKTGSGQAVELEWKPKLPAEYERKRGRRSGRRVASRITLRLSLNKGSRRLEIDARVDNRSKGHRLRLWVNTGVASDFSFASAPFEVVKRDRRDLLKGIRDDGTQPNSGMVAAMDKERSLAVLNEGVYEYEHLLNKRGSLAFTLVRSTGEIINDGYVEPEFEAEPAREWICPENQCLREVSFRLAVVPGVKKIAELERMRLAFAAPPLAFFDAADPRKFSGGRVCVQDSEVKEVFYRDLPDAEVCLPAAGSALHLKGGTVFSALKKAEQGAGYVLRGYNPSARKTKLSVEECEVGPALALDESRKGSSGSATEVGAHEIVTAGITHGNRK